MIDPDQPITLAESFEAFDLFEPGAHAVERPSTPAARKLGRNDPCHCGSGKKYKKCCLAKDESLPSDRALVTKRPG